MNIKIPVFCHFWGFIWVGYTIIFPIINNSNSLLASLHFPINQLILVPKPVVLLGFATCNRFWNSLGSCFGGGSEFYFWPSCSFTWDISTCLCCQSFHFVEKVNCEIIHRVLESTLSYYDYVIFMTKYLFRFSMSVHVSSMYLTLWRTLSRKIFSF